MDDSELAANDLRRTLDAFERLVELDAAEQEQALADLAATNSAIAAEVRDLLRHDRAAGDPDTGTQPAARHEGSSAREPPRLLDRYELREKLGEGGSGVVYRAVPVTGEPRHPVAIKVLRATDPLLSERFGTEQRILGGLEHPYIARMLATGATPEGASWVAMELVAGEPITTYCDRRSLGIAARLGLFRKVLEAVDYAHAQQVIHRDLKPANVLVTERGDPKLLDFGIAKDLLDEQREQTVIPSFTPAYASPEQLAGKPTTRATDVYGLGVLLCELVCGSRPAAVTSGTLGDDRVDAAAPAVTASALVPAGPAGDEVAQARATTRRALVRTLEGGLDHVVRTALAVDPAQRYPDVAALAADLDAHVAGRPIPTAGPFWQRWRRTATSGWRQRTSRLGVYAGTITVVGLGGWLAWRSSSLPPAGDDPPRRLIPIPLAVRNGPEIDPSVSRRGDVAFAWDRTVDGNFDIFVLRAGAVEPQPLSETPELDRRPAWSPDGDEVAFVRQPGDSETSSIHAVSITTARARVLLAAGWARIDSMAWAPSGAGLLLSARPRGDDTFALWELVDGSPIRRTTPPPASIGDVLPSYSPDGRLLSFVRRLTPREADLFVLEPRTGRLRQLTRDFAPILGTTWTSDGRHLLIASERSSPRAMWRITVDSGAIAWIPAAGDALSDPTVGGGRLVSQRFTWDTDLSRLRPSADTLERIEWLASSAPESHPVWSPDCSRLAFVSSRRGAPAAFVADLARHQLTAVGTALEGAVSVVDWSPDGGSLLIGYSAAGHGRAAIVELAEGEARPVVTTHRDLRNPIFAPDGGAVIFSAFDGERWQLWRHELASARSERLTDAGGWRARVGRHDGLLYYSLHHAGGLYRLGAAGPPTPFDPNLGRILGDFWTTSGHGPIVVEQVPGVRQQALLAIEPGGARRQLAVLQPTQSVVPQLGMAAAACSEDVVVSQLVRVESDLVELVEEG